MTDNLFSNLTFSSLPLDARLQSGLVDAGFSSCTRIQAEALPLLLAGSDVLGQAQTGTGKTAAFLLATMQVLLGETRHKKRSATDPRALIVAPTRELAIQIHRDALALAQHTDIRFGLIYGGIDYDKQRRQLQDGIDVLIGTPGRIIDFHKQRLFSFDFVEVAVVDEADRMFDLGFIRDIRYLMRRIPPPEQRLSMLFSATMSFRVNELAYEHMNNPTLIEIAPDKRTVDKVSQVLYHVGSEEKFSLLLGLFRRIEPVRTLVFVNTKAVAIKVAEHLVANGINAVALSGDVPQNKRQRYILEFADGRIGVLVATDVAARGLHIPDVSHVINFDLPQNAEDYVHRIGRTARAGSSGDAISLACEQYVFSLPDIEEYLGHVINTQQIDDKLLVEGEAAPVRRRSRGRRGDRRRPARSAVRTD